LKFAELCLEIYQISRVHIQAWQEAYQGLIPATYLDGLSDEFDERVEMWQNILANPKRWAWVAVKNDSVVGFILFGPPRDENHEYYIELGAIYLLAAHKAMGIGFALLSAGFNFMKSLGYQKSYCWVLEGNPTTRFYENTGAKFSGQTKVEETAGKDMTELAYEWPSLDLPTLK
jgi:GNAT superfamily N-acetyltransferase